MANKRKIDTYYALTNLALKVLLTLSILLCFVCGFFFVLYLIYANHPWQNTILIGGMDSLLAFSFPSILNHFFPKNTNNQE
jgi:hypothetical protein